MNNSTPPKVFTVDDLRALAATLDGEQRLLLEAAAETLETQHHLLQEVNVMATNMRERASNDLVLWSRLRAATGGN